MSVTANMRKISTGAMLAAIVAALLSTCMVVACDMGMRQMASSSPLAIGQACVGAVAPGIQAAVAPSGPQSLILSLIAALGVALVLVSPQLTARPLTATAKAPPPSPEDPRGVRLII